MRWLTALIVVTLAGCTSGQPNSGQPNARLAAVKQAVGEAAAKRDAARAECVRLYPDANKRPVTPRVKCFNAASYAFHSATDRIGGRPSRDISRTHNARRLVASERYDKGELSLAEYELEMANSTTASISQLTERHNADAAVRAAQSQAAAARRQATAATLSATRPTTTNCNTFGGTVRCTTY